MLLRRLVVAYGWRTLAGALAASPRWSPERKARVGALAGAAISLLVVVGTAVPYVYWLLTGRGPWQRYGFSSAILADPFRRAPPAEIRAALAELAKSHGSGGSCRRSSRHR
jgi:hypothetical protein